MLSSSKIFRAMLSAIMVLMASNPVQAQLKVAFTPRFSDAVYGDFMMVGNNVLSTTATESYTGSSGNHNVTTVFVDIDNDNTTFNSSSANLTNPVTSSCVVFRKAYLYWSAADFEETNVSNEPNWNYNEVKLMLPGATTYTTVTADNVIFRGRAEHFVNDPYVCFKDITASVQALASPFGKYQVANVRTKKGSLNPDHTGSNVGTSGGWQIVFVYEGLDQQGRALLPAKHVTIFDGYANVTSSQNNYNINISGFQTPPVGSVHPELVFGALEGDRDLSGDRFQIRNVANAFVDMSTTNRPSDNFFNSRITADGTDFINRNPASTNTLGFDAGYFALTNTSNSIIANGQTSAVLRLTSNQETYGLFMLGFSIDVWAPEFEPILQTSTPTNVNAGDTISYTFQLDNNGNDDARNVVITRTLPPSVELVQPVSPLPAGVTYSYNAATRVLSFFIQDGLTDVVDPALNISYKTVVKDQCYFLESSCPYGIDAQLLATYTGVQNTQTQTTLSSSLLTPCGLGNGKANNTNLNQPAAADWSTAAGTLNRTVNCNDAQALAAAQSLFPTTTKCNFALDKISGPFVAVANACPLIGTYTNTWTFIDKCGRTSPEFTQVITVQDTTKPVITGVPQNSTVNCAGDVPAASIASVTATDNCGGTVTKTVNDVISNQSCANRYTITRTWTATDVCGNSSTASQIITVNDTTKPVITGVPQNSTVNCAGDVPAASIASVTATDNCGGTVTKTVNDVISNQSCANRYTITRTWTATDVCGNSSTASQIITVNDTTKPVITGVPQNSTVNCAGDVPASNIASVTATDNCGGTVTKTVNDVISNQSCANRYTITRTWTATDVCGNSSTATQTITVNDQIAPVITGTPQNITVNCAGDVPAANIASVTATDNCGGTVTKTVNDVISNRSCANRYTITRTWTATDVCGNSSTASQIITVNDTTKPVITGVPQNSTVNCAGDVPAANIASVTATDNCGGTVTKTVSDVISNQSCANRYMVTRTWTATDVCGNSSMASQIITVNDTTKPVITGVPQNSTVNCAGDVPAASIASVTATDNCGGTVTKTVNDVIGNQSCANRYTITRTWTATDVCGNSSTASQIITVNDTTKPVITGVPQNSTVNCAGDVPAASIASVTATDNCGGTVTKTVNDVISNQSCANRYTITRTWTATDVCGNSSTASQIITVNDTTKPVITGTPQNITVNCAGDVPAANIASVTATDNCGGTVTKTVNDVIGNQSCANRYTITRTWTATDVCGNSSTASQTITVNDTIKPLFIGQLPVDVTVNCSFIPAVEILTATDNCGQASVTFIETLTPGGCAGTGGIVRIWTAKDLCNDSVMHIQHITVQDTTRPVITGTPQDLNVSCADEVPVASISSIIATDNCRGTLRVTVSDSINNLSCTNRYTITRTWSATDVCGNSSTSSQIITVNDQIPPVITSGPQDIQVSCRGDVPPFSQESITVTDNCSGVIVVTANDTIINQRCNNQYTIIRTFKATDACGNIAASSQTITVNDQIAPVITGTPQNITVSCASDVPAASIESVTATDNCGGTVTKTVNDVVSNQSCANRYTITRTWTATDVCGNSSTATQTITVNDQIVPVITGTPQNITVSCAGDVPAASIASVTATDNCSGTVTKTVNDVVSNQSCANRYTITRTWTATDVCGNVSTSTQIITVRDTIKPEITGVPEGMMLSCADDVPPAGIASIQVADNCTGDVTVRVEDILNAETCANKYSITRTWTATDICGNSSTAVQTIIINDTIHPSFVGQLPGDITVNCNSIPDPELLTATDNCGQAAVTFSETSIPGACIGTGGFVRTWTARDVCGNSTVHIQHITVQDTTSPSITGTPADITLLCANDIPSASETIITATDNCSGRVTVRVRDTVINQICANRFVMVRTWIATDVCGNSSETHQTIKVNDSISPQIIGTPEDIVVACSGEVPPASAETVRVTDNCSGAVIVQVKDSIVNRVCDSKYAIRRIWTAVDVCGNTTTAVQVITVNDSIAPVFEEVPENITVACSGEVPSSNIANVKVVDNCTRNAVVSVNDIVDSSACANRYTITRTWTATDACGNSTSASQLIIVNDTVKPQITDLPQDITVSCTGHVPPADRANVTASDNCNGVVTVRVQDAVSAQVCANKYTITRTWTATDACGNSSTASQVITVNDTIKPVFTGVLPADLNICDALPNVPVMTASDNCGAVDVLFSETVDSVSVPNVKTYIRTWTAIDLCQNTAVHRQLITLSPSIHVNISREICEGELVALGNNAYGISGIYTATFTGAKGCDSIVTMNLTVNPIKNTNINAVICHGEQIVIGEHIYTESVTNEIITLQTSKGCDSIITLNIVVLNSDTIITNRTICNGNNVEIVGQLFNTSGTYYIPFFNNQCEGIVRLNLSVINPSAATLSYNICQGEVVTVGGQVFSTNGVHTVVLSNAQGCDSIITLNLTVQQETGSVLNRTICSGQSLTVGTQVFNESGTYPIALSNAAGCDSNVILNLIVMHAGDTTSVNRTICSGDVVTIEGQVFNESGIYYIPSANENCPGVIALSLRVNEASAVTLNKFICAGEAVVVGNQTFTATGTYTIFLQNSTGCDSVVTLHLDVSEGGSKTVVDSTICFGKSMVFEGQTFSSTGTYQIIFPVDVCRDTLLLNLKVNAISESRIDTAVCDTMLSGGITIGGQLFSEPGRYNITVQNALGCDSLITLNIRIFSCAPLGEEIVIYDTLPVATTHQICSLSIPPGNNTSVEVCNGGTSGTAPHGTWAIDAQTNCLVFTAGTVVGNDTLFICACDTVTRQCNTTQVIITVTGLPPLATDDCVEELDKNKEIIITVLENDTDPDHDALFVEGIVTQPQYGTASVDQRGQNIIYIPNKNFCGRDTFYYVVCDGDDGCDTAMVCVKVNCLCEYPQVITPNGDGYNDYLFFPCLGNVDGAKLLVWHRWGLIVHEDDNYKNNWDGRLKGELLPAGTYWYSIEFDDPETKEHVKEVNYFMIIN